MSKTTFKIQEPLVLHWRYHTSSKSYVRVWRTDWFGDVFEVLNYESFEALQKLTSPFGVQFVEHGEEED